MKLKLSISTCPNDTFMFDAMLHRRIDTEGLDFDLTMADIEQLNAAALAGEPDITKLSYAAASRSSADRYRILGSGSALGRGNGPTAGQPAQALPGRTARRPHRDPGRAHDREPAVDRCFSPKRPTNRRAYLFSDIADAVLSGRMRRRRTDPRRPIHVPRESGLRLVADLGEEWEKRTSTAVAARSHRRFAPTGRATGTGRSSAVLRRSVEYALCSSRQHRPASCRQPCPRTERGGDAKPHRAVREPTIRPIWERKGAERSP